MNRRAAFLLALLPQLGFVGWLTWQGERTLALGRLVTLDVEATAPIDPLRGRYLRLEYAASHVDGALGPLDDATSRVGQTVYVAFMRAGDEWWPYRYAFELIESETGETAVLAGTLRSVSEGRIEVDYAFDQYFIPNDGLDVHGLADVRLRVRLRVDATSGRGVIEDVLVDGQPYLEWNRREHERRGR
ncbi:MAG: GDYXXLXY domain-containing protein [Planctomycetes bacterium]|nr:GDYXXLXY domain-containing protein [Planctomycetota bacterium]MCC7172715.1 GDYXXLXY domain-containing protein [Planctomycetota bacterium]